MSDQTPPISGDRGVSQIAGFRGWWNRKRVLMAGGAVLAVGIAYFVLTVPITKPRQAEEDKSGPKWAPPAAWTPPKPDPLPAPVQPTHAALAQPLMAPPAMRETMQQPAPAASSQPQQPAHTMYTYSVAELPASMKPRPSPAQRGEDTGEPHHTSIAYKAERIVGAKAAPMGDRSLILMPGLVRCNMHTAIDSTLKGPFECEIPDDIKSPTGVTLLDAHTQVTGDYDSHVSQGQKRLTTMAGTAWTPNGCAVPIGEPMADSVGRTGLEGDYDPHTWERLGGALLLMGANNLFQLGTTALQHGNGNSYFQLNTGDVSSLASEVLRNTINIPPTITIHQGEDVAIWITKPIDFSDCYKLVPRG